MSQHPDLTTADSSTETMQRVTTTLRAALQCWRCGTDEEVVIHSGELDGPRGPLPLFACVPCGRELERLYYAAFGHQPPVEAPDHHG